MRPASLRPAARLARLSRAALAVALAGVLLAAASLADAADPADVSGPRDTVLRVHGSDTIGASLMGELLLPFLQAEGWKDVSRVPSSGGTSYNFVGRPSPAGKRASVYVEISDPESGLSTLDQGFADLTMSSRRIRPAEVRQFSRLGDLTSPACEHVLALDAVAVIVNAINPIESLTRQQLKDIYLRRVTSWQEVGGSGPIHLYARDAKSGTHATFQAAILEDEDLPPDAPRQPDNRSLSDAVAADPRGIGVVAHTFAGNNRVVAISDGKPEPRVTHPTTATIRSGAYPMTRRLYLYTAATSENLLVGRFLAFALGPAGQAIVTKNGPVSALTEPARAPYPEPVASPAPSPSPSPVPPPADANPSRAPAPVAAAPGRPARAKPQPTPAADRPRAAPTPRVPRPAARKPRANPATPTGPVEDPPSAGTDG